MFKKKRMELNRAAPPWATADPVILRLLEGGPHKTVAALTGGIASGKTVIGELFSLMGARIIDFDILARRAVEPETPGWLAVKNLFGLQVLQEDQNLNRALVGQIVFNHPGLKKQLEDIIHPEVWRLMGEELKNCPGPVVIVVIPLLFEAGLNRLFNPIILALADRKIQLKRLTARSRLSPEEARARLESQLPAEPKKPYCRYIIDNNDSFMETIRQARLVFNQLLK